MRLRRALATVAAAVPVALVPAGSAVAAPPEPAVYLALGDSVAAGVGAPPGAGYVDLLYAELADPEHCGKGKAVGCRLTLVNLAESGATSVDLLAEQIPDAVELIEAREATPTEVDDVELVTVTIGGNDVFGPVLLACIPTPKPTCAETIDAQFRQVAQNLTLALAQLDAALDDDAVLLVTTYYNPLPGCVLAAFAPFGDLVLEGGTLGGFTLEAGLNVVIRAVARQFDAVVAEGAVVDSFVGGGDCLHPDAEGHEQLADAVGSVLPSGRLTAPGHR